jgi:hypothetical protein
MSVATSYNVTSTQGAREDLANILRFVSPSTTPMYSTLKQSAAPKAVLTEWLGDVLASPDANGVIDGVDMSFNADFTDQINSRVRLGNRVQTVRRAYAVSRQAQMIDVAPGESLMAASKAKSLTELKTDIETIIGSGASQVAGSGSVAAKSQGLGVWSDPSAAVADVPASVLSVSGSRFNYSSGSAMTEANFRSVLQAVYEASGSKTDYRLFAGPAIVNAISDMSRANANSAAFNQEVGGGRLTLSITEYQSDYGSVKCIPDLFLGREVGSAITSSSTDNPAIITTTAAHGLTTGDTVTISGVTGNDAINGTFVITVTAPTTFTITGQTGAAGAGTGGLWTRGYNTDDGVLNSNRAYLIPGDDTVSLKFLEGITTQNLPDLAAGPRAFVEAMISLCVTNPRALGSII